MYPQQPMQPPIQPGAQQPMQQLSPELVQAILQLQQQNAAQGAIGRQRKGAESLLQSGADQMQGQMVGGSKVGQVYVPPNLANLGASLFTSYRAKQAMDDADLREQNMGVQRGDALRHYFEAMSGAAPRRMGHMGDEGE